MILRKAPPERTVVETVGCLFHPGAPSSLAHEENGYTGRRCERCGLIYLSPRPSPDEVVALYVEDHAHVSADAHLAGVQSWPERRRARRTVRHIEGFVRGGRLLEIGAGGGDFAFVARERGFDPVTVELNPMQAAFIRNDLGIPCAESLAEVEAEGPSRFDVIYHCNVLSHLSDPLEEFRRLRVLLRDGGIMAFETGNGADVDPKYYPRFPTFQYPDHLYFFGERTIDALLEQSGFRRLATRRYSLLPALAVERRIHAFGARGGGSGPGGSSRDGAVGGGSGLARSLRSRLRGYASTGVWALVNLLAYDVGAIVPKVRRPQTMLVVARRD